MNLGTGAANIERIMPHPLFGKARQSWLDGKALLENGSTNSAANRLYYAVFQAAKAHFVEKGRVRDDEKAEIHGKIKSLLSGSFQKDTFEDLRGYRETGDYLPDPVRSEELEAILKDAEDLFTAYIKMENWNKSK